MKRRSLLTWLLLSALVLLAAAVMVRLGFWQLDRLHQRQKFNLRVTAAQSLPELDLTRLETPAGLGNMEYRSATVRGEYLFSEQVALRNQVHEGMPGLHLLTPLQIEGKQVTVLVDRGWIPLADADPQQWAKYDQPGVITVKGVIRRGQTRPEIGSRNDPALSPGQSRLETWNLVNLDRIAAQAGLALMPVYLQQEPGGETAFLPAPGIPVLDLSEGPHQAYAMQWFTFAIILLIGYPIFVYRSLHHSNIKPVQSLGGVNRNGIQEKRNVL